MTDKPNLTPETGAGELHTLSRGYEGNILLRVWGVAGASGLED